MNYLPNLFKLYILKPLTSLIPEEWEKEKWEDYE